MNLDTSYKILGIDKTATNEEIVKSFKNLAMKYHPDRNRDRIEWANEQMSALNSAYSFLMSFRFSSDYTEPEEDVKPAEKKKQNIKPEKSEFRDELSGLREEARKDYLINRFSKAKEEAKNVIYRYFQYNLYNFHRRDIESNSRIYKRIVVSLRKSYHAIKKLSALTEDRELLDHFNLFSDLIFMFYKASECINILDSHNDRYEVHAYRIYRKADEILNISEREIFFERHNRGEIVMNKALPGLNDSEKLFMETIKTYPKSSWVVEAEIKLEYCRVLKNYLMLFFSE